ncbi:MAG: three-Cys-motif partner protein TcmP, partial [candidate division Zixibacteria bacterium]
RIPFLMTKHRWRYILTTWRHNQPNRIHLKSAVKLSNKPGPPLWSEDKLNILKEYTEPYSKIMSNQPRLSFCYIDAFSDKGKHISRETNKIIPGSPLQALSTSPLFPKYYFIDIDPKKIKTLKKIIASELQFPKDKKPEIIFKEGDCNEILLNDIFPDLTYGSYNRALCFLDPYGMHLSWQVLEMAGKLETIDIFLNFSIYDMNLNALHHNVGTVKSREIKRINRMWGDDSWKDVGYISQPTLFGDEDKIKRANKEIVIAFQKRLRHIAGFKYVPEPIAMKNSKNTVVYYLFFASAKKVAAKIATDIFMKYRR